MPMPAALPEQILLRILAEAHPNAKSASAELAAERARLTLPAGTIHVISDVHGEYKKLRHVINNASGSLRVMIERLFAGQMDAAHRQDLLAVLYYPQEEIAHLRQMLAEGEWRRNWVAATLRAQFALIRELAADWRRKDVIKLLPGDQAELFGELLLEPLLRHDATYIDAMLDSLRKDDHDLEAVRAASHLVRNLACEEIIVAGDLGDRGPRLDKVVDYLMQQPNVAIIWGNHDAEWMGACLGQEALIASVLRFSTRYNRLAQLEEGYGIPMEPLEKLAREVYGDDPCAQFKTSGDDLRDAGLVRRMQKGAAILQFKLEAAAARRHPEWNLEHRNLLHRIDRAGGTVNIDGKVYPLLDRNFPTVDANDPYALSPAERACMDSMKQAFLASGKLWDQMRWIVNRGWMWTRRREALIFHACVAVDGAGNPLPLMIDDALVAGRAQMDAIDVIIRRAFRRGASVTHRNDGGGIERGAQTDLDWFWYLWVGDRSPLFGKDKMATFEGYFVADAEAREEHKNAYFEMIHDADFCRRIGRDFGMDDDVMIVNGHVPVRIEQGENPVKRGGNAVTIDGAFSEAYGDHGYTLILDPHRMALAEHAHFESVEQVIAAGADMVPKMKTIREYERAKTVADTEEAGELLGRIDALGRLIEAYLTGMMSERTG